MIAARTAKLPLAVGLADEVDELDPLPEDPVLPEAPLPWEPPDELLDEPPWEEPPP